MGLLKLWKALIDGRVTRRLYHIRPSIRFSVDTTDYVFSLLPTVIFQPWPYRWEGSAVINIAWLNFHIALGEWRYRQ